MTQAFKIQPYWPLNESIGMTEPSKWVWYKGSYRNASLLMLVKVHQSCIYIDIPAEEYWSKLKFKVTYDK